MDSYLYKGSDLISEELLKKLRYKIGQAAVVNGPDGYQLGIESEANYANGKYDFVQLFVNNSQEVMEWMPKVIPLLNEDALFWITYPKQSSKTRTDINRDSLFTLIQNISTYRPVSNIAIDDTWSALRLREKEKVKTKKK
jgi:hypothetical protein